MRALIVGALVACGALIPSAGAAQEEAPIGLGVTGLVAAPIGPLAKLRSTNVGLSGLARYEVPGMSGIAVRFEIAGLPPSNQLVPSGPCPCSAASLTTGSSLVLAGFGPEFSVRVGIVKAYAVATAGVARVWSTSILAQGFTPAGGLPFSNQTATHATNFAWTAGGGVLVPLGTGRSGAAINLGVKYYDAGNAAYRDYRLLAPSAGGNAILTALLSRGSWRRLSSRRRWAWSSARSTDLRPASALTGDPSAATRAAAASRHVAPATTAASVFFMSPVRTTHMCRNIKTLANFEPPATDTEIRASALQFVRKLSGTTRPSRANEVAFNRAVDEVAGAADRLIRSLQTNASPRDREAEMRKARERSRKRFQVDRAPGPDDAGDQHIVST